MSSPSKPGRFYPTVRINPVPFRSATCDSCEANADITGVERRTAGHPLGLGYSNFYKMCADHPRPSLLFLPASLSPAVPSHLHSARPAPPLLSPLRE